MAAQAALEVVGLTKLYGAHRAVDGVDLRVREGEIHGLLGPNGAGKTTLMRMLLGLVQPDAGGMRLLGLPAGTAASPVPGGVAGYVDTPQFYPYLSGRRNLRLLARLDGECSTSRAAERVDEALDYVGLAAQADARVGGYSAGMRQRLGLAAALLRSPRLLLLDEPTHSLDPAGARDLRAHVRRLAAEGVAVLLSSHDMAEVEDLCDGLTIVNHGRVVFSGTVDDLRRRAPDAAHRLRTSDDERARAIAGTEPDVQVTPAEEGQGLDVSAGEAGLDRFVVALGRAGVAVRALERRDRSLESLFLWLTSPSGPPPPPAARAEGPRDQAPEVDRAPTLGGVRAVVAVECAKLAAQLKVWAVLAVCLAGPFAFVAALALQSTVPDDTLFGRFAKTSGFAVPLVVLGFAAAWAFPVLTSVVGGDLFSAEDRYGTWSTLLTRSRTRGEVFAGKAVTSLSFSLVAVSALAIGSVAAGATIVGRQPLVGLSGTLLPPGRALELVAGAWASVLPPVFGFTGLAALLSVATRSSAAGVGLPVLTGLLMELFSLANGPDVVRRLLLTPPFMAWHGLFAEHVYFGPLLEGTAISAAYLVGCFAGAHALLWRRDMVG